MLLQVEDDKLFHFAVDQQELQPVKATLHNRYIYHHILLPLLLFLLVLFFEHLVEHPFDAWQKLQQYVQTLVCTHFPFSCIAR